MYNLVTLNNVMYCADFKENILTDVKIGVDIRYRYVIIFWAKIKLSQCVE